MSNMSSRDAEMRPKNVSVKPNTSRKKKEKKKQNRGKQGRNDRSAIYSSISSGKKFVGAHSEELTFRR